MRGQLYWFIMKCPRCNSDVFDDSNFCGKCGYSFLEDRELETKNEEEFDMSNFLFIPKGRIKRRPYVYYLIFYISVFLFVGVFITITSNHDVQKMNLALFTTSLALIYPTIVVTWKRLQDFNVHGVFSLLLLMPVKFFFLIFVLVISFIPSSPGRNNFDLKKK